MVMKFPYSNFFCANCQIKPNNVIQNSFKNMLNIDQNQILVEPY